MQTEKLFDTLMVDISDGRDVARDRIQYLPTHTLVMALILAKKNLNILEYYTDWPGSEGVQQAALVSMDLVADLCFVLVSAIEDRMKRDS